MFNQAVHLRVSNIRLETVFLQRSHHKYRLRLPSTKDSVHDGTVTTKYDFLLQVGSPRRPQSVTSETFGSLSVQEISVRFCAIFA